MGRQIVILTVEQAKAWAAELERVETERDRYKEALDRLVAEIGKQLTDEVEQKDEVAHG